MSRKEDGFITPSIKKKLRFRGDINLQNFDSRVEDIFDEPDKRTYRNTDRNVEDPPKGNLHRAAFEKP